MASCIRCFPSRAKGVVTTPIVRAPISFAIEATIGAEPVPVPPPIPAVTKTMLAPFKILEIFSLSSCAAFSPISGSPPAPSPCVSFCPIASLEAAFERPRACLSVFKAMNSTPFMFASIMRFTAFEPPPPQPITLIIVGETSDKSEPSPLTTSTSIIIPPDPTFRIKILAFL